MYVVTTSKLQRRHLRRLLFCPSPRNSIRIVTKSISMALTLSSGCILIMAYILACCSIRVALQMAKEVVMALALVAWSLTLVALLGILSWLAVRIAIGLLQFYLGIKLWMDFLFCLFVMLLLEVLLLLWLIMMMLLL